MSNQNTSLREIIKAIPQVDFDIIGRLIPGTIVIGSILLAAIGTETGPESFWNKLLNLLNSTPKLTIFVVLVILASYTLATLLWCFYSLLMKIFFRKKYWDNEKFRWKYEKIKYKNPSAGDRITKLKAHVHMAETLIPGFFISSLIDLGLAHHLHDFSTQRIVSTVILFLAAVCSLNAWYYFVHHMIDSLDNNLRMLEDTPLNTILLFDFDGTLVDINKLQAYRTVVQNHGHGNNPNLAEELCQLDSQLCLRGEYDRRKVFEKYAAKFNIGVKELCRVFWKELTHNQHLKSRCLETLKTLKKEGHILACVTDSDGFGGNKLKRIKATGLVSYFDKIFIGGDKKRPRKGSAEYMEWVTKELALPFTQWFMIGDKTKIDLEPAKKMGMVTILVKNAEYPDYWPIEVENLPELIPII